MAQVISDDVMKYLHISLNIVARSIISVVGVITNLISMIIFSKLGLKDSMSAGLFSLSLTDFLVTGIQLASCISLVIDLSYVNTGTDAMFLGYYTLGWAITALYDVSCWITVMISLERCYCVVSPFSVRQVFTRYRCAVAIIIMYTVYMAIHAPIYVHQRMEMITILTPLRNSTINGTQETTFMIRINQKVQLLELILDITAGVSLWLISQAVIIVCTVYMAYSVEVSAKIRHTTSIDVQKTIRGQPQALSNRERRMVKVFLFLAVTLTSCNVPTLITTTVFYTFPGANSGTQENLSAVLWTVAIAFRSLGCSVSFAVYLTLNDKYRRKFIEIFGCRVDTSKIS